ncbi:Hypothetical predicted protein, partial [Mytilus galloprovincialis]
DEMSYYNGMKFTKYDQDNDNYGGNCANNSVFRCGWWYNECWNYRSAMLDGYYTQRNSSIQGIRYQTLLERIQKNSTMNIRKV